MDRAGRTQHGHQQPLVAGLLPPGALPRPLLVLRLQGLRFQSCWAGEAGSLQLPPLWVGSPPCAACKPQRSGAQGPHLFSARKVQRQPLARVSKPSVPGGLIDKRKTTSVRAAQTDPRDRPSKLEGQGASKAAQDCNPTPAGADRAHPQASGNTGSRPDLGVQCVFSGVTASPRSPTALHPTPAPPREVGAHLSEQHHAYLRDFCKLSVGLTALLGCFHGNFIVVHKGPVHAQLAGLRGEGETVGRAPGRSGAGGLRPSVLGSPKPRCSSWCGAAGTSAPRALTAAHLLPLPTRSAHFCSPRDTWGGDSQPQAGRGSLPSNLLLPPCSFKPGHQQTAGVPGCQ